jgi:protein subunit release factor B
MIYKCRRRVNERKNFKMKILNTHNTTLKHKIKSINIKVNAFITYII